MAQDPKSDGNDTEMSEKEREEIARKHAEEGRGVHDETLATGQDVVEEASEDSFPASDPPSFTP